MMLGPHALALPAANLALGVAKKVAGAVKDALTPEEQKVRKTADEFEKMFLENMMSQVFPQEAGEGPLGENGQGAHVWRGMLVNEYARSVAKSGGIGIADQVYRQMLQLQENSNGR